MFLNDKPLSLKNRGIFAFEYDLEQYSEFKKFSLNFEKKTNFKLKSAVFFFLDRIGWLGKNPSELKFERDIPNDVKRFIAYHLKGISENVYGKSAEGLYHYYRKKYGKK